MKKETKPGFNMARLFFYGVCILAAYMTFNLMKTGKLPGVPGGPLNSYTLNQPAQALHYTQPLKCSLNYITVATVEDKSAVLGSNYMAAYKSSVKTDDGLVYPLYLITDGVTGPWIVGQRYAVLGTCEEISAPDLAAVRTQYASNLQVKENDCVGVFYWDTAHHQVSRQCGQSLGDYFYLGWDSRRPQAPLKK
jgi:hypothetical protein